MSNANSIAQKNVTPISKDIDFNLMVDVDGHEIFPEVFQKNQMKLKVRKNRHPFCQESDKNYVPDVNTLKKCLAWWFAPQQLKPLGLVGETGTGKTELLLFIADRLNEPVHIESIKSGLSSEKFEGGMELTTNANGDVITKRRFSKAATGYQHGGLVILDEIDKANEDLQSSMHMFMEGKPWTLSSFGLTINKHANCRIAVTANTTGSGSSDRYTTSQRLDQALRSRIGWLKTAFPEISVELNILQTNFPKLPLSILQYMVKTANVFRDEALGQDRKGDVDTPLGCIFSTRTLVHWGFYMMCFGTSRSPYESLEFTFMGSVDDDEVEIVEQLLQRVWGDELHKPLKELLLKK
ncbi:AAA family ATPase [Pseudoalteromonas spongiae]|uniref:AAA family ATPase n=1 Tax=Pseudoalteromonas spongiae TaxID=298657 RepID=UPI000C2D5C4F|nr:AAA family ATPase [Pseudoalteromonas spongiae]